MKKSILVLAFAFASGGISFAQTGNGQVGIFGSGIELDATGALATNNGTTTLYALNQSDNNVLKPTGSTATLSTAWANGTPASPVLNLGSFDETLGNTLTLTGGSLLTYSNSGASPTAGQQNLNYQIEDATLGYFSGFSPVSLPFNATGATVDGNGNTRFATEALSTNLLAGLAAGTYILNVYNSSGYTDPVANPNSGTFYDSQGGANYGATFTVVAVPEPMSASLLSVLLIAFGGMVWNRKRLANCRLS